jgi:hypothetical protein
VAIEATFSILPAQEWYCVVLTATSRARVPKKGEEMDAHKINEKRANTI